MRVALVDYGAGNLHSARRALERGLLAAGLQGDVIVTDDPDVVARGDRIVLPGDGAFADCAANLRAAPGLVEALEEAVRGRGAPFLGICVGMQLLATVGREDGDSAGLGWVPGEVSRLAPADPALKVPHIGWNTLEPARSHPLTQGIPLGPEGRHAYFLHAYALRPADPADLVASALYGGPVAAVVARDNVAGTQFHPEKSQALGLALLANFLNWSP